MKRYTFEIHLTESMLDEDDFLKDALKKDGTGIEGIQDCIAKGVNSYFILNKDYDMKDFIRLVKFEDK